MTQRSTDVFYFADLKLDINQGRLTGPAGDVALRPKSFSLLSHLAANAGRVVPKDELMSHIWPVVHVTEDSLTQCICDLRRSLGEAGAALLRTVPRRGYLFDLPMTTEAPFAPVAPPDAAGSPTPAMQQGSLAVMPFHMAAMVAPEDRLWFDGVVNDVISQLARLRSFDVISRGSSFALRSIADDPVRAGQKLGVSFVLSGSVAPRGHGFCLRVDLIRVDTGAILWTDEIGVNPTGMLELVGALVDRIIGAVLTGITTAERNRARLIPDQSLTAWQAYHRGVEAFAIYTEPFQLQARAYFQKATELDPGFVRAFAALSDCQATLARAPFETDRKHAAEAALRTAEHAMGLDEDAPSAQFAYGHARWLHGDIVVASRHAHASVRLSPSFAEGFAEIGFYEAQYGDARHAIDCLARAEVLTPLTPFLDSMHIDRAVAHLQLGQTNEAAHWARSALYRRGSYPQMQLTGAMVLAASGETEEGRAVMAPLLREGASFDPQKIFKPPYELQGRARDAMQAGLAELHL